MGILNSIANIIKGYDFSDPVVIKDSTVTKRQLEEMALFRNELSEKGQALIDIDIKIVQAGNSGEDSLLYELKNSHLPILIMRDLQLSFKGLDAQIDFIVLSPKAIYVLECKKMIGDIEVHSNGDFIRKFSYGRRTHKEGLYSPITQNQRHIDLLRDIFKANQENIIVKVLLNNEFNKLFHPFVVMANSNTVLNMKYAKKEVKEKIIRLDQLNRTIKDHLYSSEKAPYNYSELEQYALSILNYHRVKPFDFKKKYEQYLKPVTINPIKESLVEVVKEPEVKVLVESEGESIESSPMYQALKKYRLEQSRKENVKPYFLFNNLQLEALVKSAPKNREELLKINGFGTVKCDKYGEDIINILNKSL